MKSIERLPLIDSSKLKSEAYFASLVQEAYDCGLIYDSEIEKLQMESIRFLAYKSERYSSGDSSSIRVETAESIMKSNLYTIGLYLKSLSDTEAIEALKTADISEMYRKGRSLIDTRFRAAKALYRLTEKNRLHTPNYTYNATLSKAGIGSFFKDYNPDYEAHETPASIDYQLCNTVTGLEGVEYIERYLGRLYLENEFCRNFAQEDIHHLLSGYDSGYQDLLINIFEQVLIGAIGCRLAERSAVELNISRAEVQCLYIRLSELDEAALSSEIRKAAGKVLEELNIKNPSLRRYVVRSLPGITTGIACAVRTDTIEKTFVAAVNLEMQPRIKFSHGIKMDDEDYRKLIDELLSCRYISDKLAIIRDRVKSFGDFEDVIFDAGLEEEEVTAAFDIVGDIEIAALIKRHSFISDIQAVDLSESEVMFRTCLRNYIGGLAPDRQKRLLEMSDNIIDDDAL